MVDGFSTWWSGNKVWDCLVYAPIICYFLPHQRVLMLSGESKKPCLKNRGATYYFFMPSLVMILFLPLPAMGKSLYLMDFVLETLMNAWTNRYSLMYKLVGMWWSFSTFMYHAPGTALAVVWCSMFSQNAAAGLVEALPSTEGAAAQHSLGAYLQAQNCMDAVAEHVYMDPCGYGWTLGGNSYETVSTLDPMAAEELLKFISCNCKGDCSNWRYSCKKNDVKCISACQNCKGITCKNCIDDGESGEDSEIDAWGIRTALNTGVMKIINNNEWVWSFSSISSGSISSPTSSCHGFS